MTKDSIRVFRAEWDAYIRALEAKLKESVHRPKKIVTVECYQGVYFDELLGIFTQYLKPGHVITSRDYFLPPGEVERITFPDVTDDRIFGYLTRLNMTDLIDKEKAKLLKKKVEDASDGVILIFGYGASLISEQSSVLVYADMPRWEIQLRMRANKVDNLENRKQKRFY